MFSHSFPFLLIIFTAHCYAKFPFPSPLGIISAKPPNCPQYTIARECTNQRFESVPIESWCIWSDADGCLWDVQNIRNFYCRYLTLCNSPFCILVVSPRMYTCEATLCVEQITEQSCEQHRFTCRWYRPGETEDNPNFPVCGWPFA